MSSRYDWFDVLNIITGFLRILKDKLGKNYIYLEENENLGMFCNFRTNDTM